MVVLRRVLGDALRTRRLGQDRTLRDVSTAANVSLGYLSEIERGQKEASSELLASICEALDVRLSEVLREASGTLALAEEMAEMMTHAGTAAGTAAGSESGGPTSRPSLDDSAVNLAIPASPDDLDRGHRRDVVCAA